MALRLAVGPEQGVIEDRENDSGCKDSPSPQPGWQLRIATREEELGALHPCFLPKLPC